MAKSCCEFNPEKTQLAKIRKHLSIKAASSSTDSQEPISVNESNKTEPNVYYFNNFGEFADYVCHKPVQNFQQRLQHIQDYHRHWFTETKQDTVLCSLPPPLFQTALNEVSLEDCQSYQANLHAAVVKYKGECALEAIALLPIQN